MFLLIYSVSIDILCYISNVLMFLLIYSVSVDILCIIINLLMFLLIYSVSGDILCIISSMLMFLLTYFVSVDILFIIRKFYYIWIKILITQSYYIRDPIDSPTARQSDSLIGNIYVMCVGFLNLIYFLSNSRTKHWNAHFAKWLKQRKHILIFFFSHFYAKLSDHQAVGLSSRRTFDTHPYICLKRHHKIRKSHMHCLVYQKIKKYTYTDS